ncbi:3-oxoacyl-reductase [Xylariales sp. AK1849]|nr:3-oxoacyl-reductase [Xylariales sp. AK1849]
MVEYATYPSLCGQTISITGGIEGIGAAAGHSGSSTAEFCELQCTDFDQVKACAGKTVNDRGVVHVLVNKAGAAGPGSRVPTSGVTAESFEYDGNVNLKHQSFLMQYIVSTMQKQGSRSIINLGSTTRSNTEIKAPMYAAAKAAIVGVTRIHSKEFGKDEICYEAMIIANQSLKRRLILEEVARLMLLLAADDSSAPTGSSYVIDSGRVSDK